MPPQKEEKRPAQAAVPESDPKSEVSGTRDESDNEEEEEAEGAAGASDKKKKKKKKSKKKKAGASEESSNPTSKLSDAQLQQLLALNPALSNEIQGEGSTSSGNHNVVELLRQMNLQEILTGLPSGRSVKDMGAYKFWKTQPVPSFDEEVKEEGPVQVKTVDEVAKQPSPLPDGFEWVTMDLTTEEEMKEVHDLLEGHYVEDDTAMLRFNYSFSILQWYVVTHTLRLKALLLISVLTESNRTGPSRRRAGRRSITSESALPSLGGWLPLSPPSPSACGSARPSSPSLKSTSSSCTRSSGTRGWRRYSLRRSPGAATSTVSGRAFTRAARCCPRLSVPAVTITARWIG